MDIAWPNLFIPGAPKAGTTSLWRYLSDHPEIYMSPLKEPGFLSRDPGGGGIRDEQAYLELFAKASSEKWRGEASVAYFSDTSSPARIRAASPDSKVIILLRNPVERAYSDYWYYVRRERETRPFRKAVEQTLAIPRERGAENTVSHYLDRGFYVAPLERYLSTFGDNVLVLFLEELGRNTRGEMQRVYDFLGVEAPDTDEPTTAAHNEFEVPRSGLAPRLVHSPVALAIGRRLPKGPRRKVVQLVTHKRRKPKMDTATRDRLRELYEHEREPLERLLGRTLPW